MADRKRKGGDGENAERIIKKPRLREGAELSSGYDRLFLKHRNLAFGEELELATRGAFFVVLLSLPMILGEVKGKDTILWSPLGSNYPVPVWWDSTIVVMFIYTLYKGVGPTLNFALDGLLGTAVAVANMWLMQGFFPHGVHQDGSGSSPPHVWWVGTVNNVLFVVLVIHLNFRGLFKIWALAYHVYFAMCFMDPHNKEFGTKFKVSTEGEAVRTLMQASVGGIFAVVACFFPYPIWTLEKVKKDFAGFFNLLNYSWDEAIKLYCAPKWNGDHKAQIEASLAAQKDALNAFSGDIGTAWWEMLVPNRGKTKRELMVMIVMEKVLPQSINSFATMLHGLEKAANMGQRGSVDRAKLKPILDEANVATRKLTEAVVKASLDGNFSQDELRQIDDLKKESQATKEKLAKQFREAIAGQELDEALVADHSLCMHLCARSQRGVEIAGQFTGFLNQDMGTYFRANPFKRYFDPNVIYNPDHARHTLRQSLSVLLSFAVGYHGVGHLVAPFSSGVPGPVTLLLSDFVSFSKDMNRVLGVVLGNILGELGYLLLANCDNPLHQLIMALALFFWVQGTLFGYYHASEWSGIMCLMAAIGAQRMAKGCGGCVAGSLSFAPVVEALIGIVLMTLVDVLFPQKLASELACVAVTDACQAYDAAWQDLCANEGPGDPKQLLKLQDFKSKIDKADALGREAALEVRFHRTPWREELYRKTIQALNLLHKALSVLYTSGGSRVSLAKLKPLKGFQQLQKDIHSRIGQLCSFLCVFEYVADGTPGLEHFTTDLQERREAERGHLQELLKEVGQRNLAAAEAGNGSDSLEGDAASELSTVAMVLDMSLDEMNWLQKHLIRG